MQSGHYAFLEIIEKMRILAIPLAREKVVLEVVQKADEPAIISRMKKALMARFNPNSENDNEKAIELANYLVLYFHELLFIASTPPPISTRLIKGDVNRVLAESQSLLIKALKECCQRLSQAQTG